MIPFLSSAEVCNFCDNFDICFMKFTIFCRNWGKFFQYSKLEDLYNLQQVCPKFKELIEDLKRVEIENDWRLIYSKYEKFGSEISATGAIKWLENIDKDIYFKGYTLKGRFFLNDTIGLIDHVTKVPGSYVDGIFNEVNNWSLLY